MPSCRLLMLREQCHAEPGAGLHTWQACAHTLSLCKHAVQKTYLKHQVVAAVSHGGPIQVPILVRNTVCVMYQNKPPLGGSAIILA